MALFFIKLETGLSLFGVATGLLTGVVAFTFAAPPVPTSRPLFAKVDDEAEETAIASAASVIAVLNI